MSKKPEKSDTGGVQSLTRAFALLESVAKAPNGVGLSDLGRQVGLHSSTTFNLARTMVGLGYLSQSPDDKRYRIGRSLLCLAANAIDDLFLTDKAKGVMESLSRLSGETSTFAVWSGQNVIALARTNGAGAFQLTDRLGAVRPPHATATGRILLAALPADRFEEYLAHADLARFTPTTITSARELRDEIARIRKTGMALDNAQFHVDVCCIAVPVFDFSGKTVGSLGVSAPVERMTARARAKHAVFLHEAARTLSAELGHAGPAGTAGARAPVVAVPDATPPRRRAAPDKPRRPVAAKVARLTRMG